MKKSELEKLEQITYGEEIPLLDELYVVVSRRKHDSGYKTYKVYGVAHGDKRKITYAKCLSEISDVINIIPTFVNECGSYYLPLLSIDSIETNMFRIFVRHSKIKVKETLSDFEFEIVKVKEIKNDN